MTAPVEYTEVQEALVEFRKKIFKELVSGRVKALLDANRDTLNKYSGIINSLSVVPYTFSNLKQKALALKLAGRDLGEGEIHQAKAIFSIGKAEYPSHLPPNVPMRMLPKVDEFIYTPPSDMAVIEKSSEEVWASLFVLQTTKDAYVDVADAENVFNDYYKFKPIGRVKLELELTEGASGYTTWTKLRGEAVVLVRELTPTGGGGIKTYDLYVLIDPDFWSDTQKEATVPLLMVITTEMATMPKEVIVAGGKRLFSDVKGLFTGWVHEGQLMGWTPTHEAYTITLKETLYASVSLLTIEVNDRALGWTYPAPDVYNMKATETVDIHGYPEEGCSIQNWELDGIQYPPADSFSIKCYRDHTVTCIFMAGGTVVLRPNASGDVTDLHRSGCDINYQCVDEEVADGYETHICNWTYNTKKRDLYNFPASGVPDGNIIDHVEVFMRCRVNDDFRTPEARTLIKTHGEEYLGSMHLPPKTWSLYSEKYTVNPYTGSAWTKSEVDALQAGVRLSTIDQVGDPYAIFAFCTQVWIEVKHHVP